MKERIIMIISSSRSSSPLMIIIEYDMILRNIFRNPVAF